MSFANTRLANVKHFGKEVTCPSTEELLRYCQAASGGNSRDAAIRRHIAVCDFCGAEAHLLAAHPPHLAEDECAPTNMPVHLHALARALLGESNHRTPLTPLNTGAGVVMTDA